LQYVTAVWHKYGMILNSMIIKYTYSRRKYKYEVLAYFFLIFKLLETEIPLYLNTKILVTAFS